MHKSRHAAILNYKNNDFSFTSKTFCFFSAYNSAAPGENAAVCSLFYLHYLCTFFLKSFYANSRA
jgi:hypothetical protein